MDEGATSLVPAREKTFGLKSVGFNVVSGHSWAADLIFICLMPPTFPDQ